jgi:toxin ParE1/3/4
MQAIGELANVLMCPDREHATSLCWAFVLLHVARRGRRGRHFLLYRAAEGQIIEIGRILHDQMDLQRHFPFPPGTGDDDSSA